MATIRNRNGKWQAQVRLKGHAARTKSFTSKRDADRWAGQTEAELDASARRVDHTWRGIWMLPGTETGSRRALPGSLRAGEAPGPNTRGRIRRRACLVPCRVVRPCCGGYSPRSGSRRLGRSAGALPIRGRYVARSHRSGAGARSTGENR